MSLTSSFTDFARSLLHHSRERFTHHQTLQAVSELPPHILKDIGWPDSYRQQKRR